MTITLHRTYIGTTLAQVKIINPSTKPVCVADPATTKDYSEINDVAKTLLDGGNAKLLIDFFWFIRRPSCGNC
jgi:hypothetical protein